MSFRLTHIHKLYTSKDQYKADVANKYIGFSVEGEGRATEHYANDAASQNIPVNCGDYCGNDVVFVSINGIKYGTVENFNKTIVEIDKALQAGAKIITDNASNAFRIYNNHVYGESGLRAYLLQAYSNIEEVDMNPKPYSIWQLKTILSKMDQNDKLFIEQAIAGYSPRNRKQREELYRRKNDMNESFKFSNKNIKRIENINCLLDSKTTQAYEQARKIEQYLLKEKGNASSFVSDYEIGFNVELFAEKKYSGIEDMEGNPFFQFNPTLFCFDKFSDEENAEMLKHESWIFNENHNAFQHIEHHPLSHQHHCALFHELYDHTYLAWQDIIDVEEVWIEVFVRVQNLQNME